MHTLLKGGVEKLFRQECYFSSGDEIEKWMTEAGIKFRKLQDRKIDTVSDVFIERFKLDEEDAKKTIEILGDKNYIFQTTWLICEQE